jgi:TolB protein
MQSLAKTNSSAFTTIRFLFVATAFALAAGSLHAQRKPVLPQIDLPHPYYFREMYLPQLTSGPSSASWSPDSQELVYSMAGSLWRQDIGSNEAQQITDGAGYDYQPDWSPDGKTVIYVSYLKDAMELWLLDLVSGKSAQLTSGEAVNVEPRWSPDGKRIVWVSTQYNRRFHIFRGDVNGTKLENVVRLTGETKSDLPRYYYSAYDTEISPVWARDGKEILFISNRGHIHGSGGFWRMRAEPGAQAREIHYEETNWRARPDFSPDGSRMVYSSYLGRQWHSLWLMPANGGDAFPVSYDRELAQPSEFRSDLPAGWDETSVRWSPDGRTLCFISNRGGNTEIWTQALPGSEQKLLEIKTLHFLAATGKLSINVQDADGKPLMARVSVKDARGKFYAPRDAWIHADDGFDRNKSPFEAHYFHHTSEFGYAPAMLEIPAGEITVDVQRGPEYRPEHRTLSLKSDEDQQLNIRLQPLSWWKTDSGQWVSSDLHVHMNYGGSYVNNPQRLSDIGEAEGLQVINSLIVNKEQRFPDIAYREDGISGDQDVMLVTGQEFHTSYWGHRGLLNLKNLLLPGYAGYPNTAAASLYPMNADVYDMAHPQGALVGAVHPFDEVPDPFANPPQKITDELPVDVALGKLDYMEIVGFSDHKSTAAVWYKLLNLGFRLPAGAGTDATTDYAAPIRSQVGADRVYVSVPQWPLNPEMWFDALKNGRTFATNGPLIELTLGGERAGSELKFEAAQAAVPFTARLRSIVPVDHLEVVCNGRVAQTLKLEGSRDSTDTKGTLPLKESGWCVLRTWSDKDEYPIMDNYAYATTSPVYVTIAEKRPRSPEDAKYFAAWITRTIEATSNYPDWNSPDEKKYVLKRLAEAKAVYEKMQ